MCHESETVAAGPSSSSDAPTADLKWWSAGIEGARRHPYGAVAVDYVLVAKQAKEEVELFVGEAAAVAHVEAEMLVLF